MKWNWRCQWEGGESTKFKKYTKMKIKIAMSRIEMKSATKTVSVINGTYTCSKPSLG